jgi:heme oxygenase
MLGTIIQYIPSKILCETIKTQNMLPLKEAIAEKHSLAEKMTFNQRMFNGEISKEEYILYLCQQLAIFDAIEIHELPHPALDRAGKVFEDIKELMGEGQIQITPLGSTNEYRKYLNKLTKEEQLPHVYLNYLAIMFGGQMMKSKIPGSGKMYEFDGDVREIAGSIRAIQKDEWADEANKALDYNINILDELQRLSESTSGETAVDGGEIA